MSSNAPKVAGFDELGDIDAANVVRCARVLLRRPLLHPGGPDGDLLPMMYRQRAVLQELFSALLGYRLVVERRFARLYKAGPGNDPTRAVPSMSPRGYAYFALTLATLTGIGQQVLLSRLASEVRAAATESGITVSDDHGDRRALTAALRQLVSLGVISETEGTVTPLANDPAAEALITIDTDMLGQLPAGPVGDADSPEELVERAAGRSVTVEHAVRRELVENPVVHYSDLADDRAGWLRNHVTAESRVLERYFGLVSESRWEGVVVSDPEDYLTDMVFPAQGTVARLALLALPELLDRAEPRAHDGRHPVTWQDLTEVCGELVDDYPAAWSRQASDDRDELVRSVVALLHRLGLLSPSESSGDADTVQWLLSPSAHRWVPHPDGDPTPDQEPEPMPVPDTALSLFDDAEGDRPL